MNSVRSHNGITTLSSTEHKELKDIIRGYFLRGFVLVEEKKVVSKKGSETFYASFMHP